MGRALPPLGQGGGPVERHIHGVPVLLQTLLEEADRPLVILHDQDVHMALLDVHLGVLTARGRRRTIVVMARRR